MPQQICLVVISQFLIDSEIEFGKFRNIGKYDFIRKGCGMHNNMIAKIAQPSKPTMILIWSSSMVRTFIIRTDNFVYTFGHLKNRQKSTFKHF